MFNPISKHFIVSQDLIIDFNKMGVVNEYRVEREATLSLTDRSVETGSFSTVSSHLYYFISSGTEYSEVQKGSYS